MFRTFTLREANALLPLMQEELARIDAAVARTRAVQAEVERLDANTKAGGNGTQIQADVSALRDELTSLEEIVNDAVLELARAGVQVQRIAPAVVDVLAQRAGNLVRLSWIEGQPAFSVWRDEEGIVRPVADDEGAFGSSLPN